MPPAARVDARLVVVVDAVPCPQDTKAALLALRDEHPGKLRLRFNAANMGASETRNRLMDVSAELLVLLAHGNKFEPTSG